MRTKWAAISLALGSLCISPAPAMAQARGSVEPPNLAAALELRIKAGDQIAVRLTTGEDIPGTFSNASESALTLMPMDQAEARQIPADAVSQVVLRRGANRLARGILIGVPIGAWLGTGGCYRVDTPGQPATGPSCGASVFMGAAIVGGVGALLGARAWHPAVVYSADRRTNTGATGKSAEARTPVSSLAALSTRLQPFDRIRARQLDGLRVSGRFLSASSTSLKLEVNGRMQEIPAGELQQVEWRGGTRVKVHMARGFLVGASVGTLVLLSGSASDDWGPGAALMFGTIVGGGIGVEVGAIAGAFDHERRVVYKRPGPAVQVAPLLGPARRGAVVSIQF